ncbi:MAG: hypothetical protein ACUVQX_01155 [Candidatus Bathycorpusculaceae bacterium]
MKNKTYFTATDIAIISVFCALWVILNLTLGPLGFTLFNLPIFCDLSVFFTLLLVVWATGKFGASSIVGIIGSIIVLMMRPSPHIMGFAASAVLFDILLLANKHKIQLKAYSLVIATLTTLISAYFAGAVIGIAFMNRPADWALTFWGGWHAAGGIISIVIAFPVIGVLEKANVRKIKSA